MKTPRKNSATDILLSTMEGRYATMTSQSKTSNTFLRKNFLQTAVSQIPA